MAVRYLVVGAFAVIYHSQPRFTKDIDLVFIKADPENARATYAALAVFGALLEGIHPEDFTPKFLFRFGHDPKGFDIHPTIPGVDFDAAWAKRVER